MNKHTPGPWVVVERLSGSENHRGFSIAGGPKHFALASVQPIDSDGIEGRANAHLIAAAPDLLEALKNLAEAVNGGGYPHKTMKHAEAAIAKAEGRA